MRSHGVAELAGVTVRTLRHYHQIGILPEPVRQSNGYRLYDLATVARLLRIRQLTDLGIPLQQVDEMLNTTPDHERLEQIDRQLGSEIDRLQKQRERISRLRETGERADMPEGLAELLSLVGPSDRAAGVLGEMDQDTLLVIARVVGPDNLNKSALSDLAETLRPLKGDAALIAATQQFDDLASDAAPPEIRELAKRMAAVLGPIVARVDRSPTGRAIAGVPAHKWPDPAEDTRLNPAQAEALDELIRLLSQEKPT